MEEEEEGGPCEGKVWERRRRRDPVREKSEEEEEEGPCEGKV